MLLTIQKEKIVKKKKILPILSVPQIPTHTPTTQLYSLEANHVTSLCIFPEGIQVNACFYFELEFPMIAPKTQTVSLSSSDVLVIMSLSTRVDLYPRYRGSILKTENWMKCTVTQQGTQGSESENSYLDLGGSRSCSPLKNLSPITTWCVSSLSHPLMALFLPIIITFPF